MQLDEGPATLVVLTLGEPLVLALPPGQPGPIDLLAHSPTLTRARSPQPHRASSFATPTQPPSRAARTQNQACPAPIQSSHQKKPASAASPRPLYASTGPGKDGTRGDRGGAAVEEPAACAVVVGREGEFVGVCAISGVFAENAVGLQSAAGEGPAEGVQLLRAGGGEGEPAAAVPRGKGPDGPGLDHGADAAGRGAGPAELPRQHGQVVLLRVLMQSILDRPSRQARALQRPLYRQHLHLLQPIHAAYPQHSRQEVSQLVHPLQPPLLPRLQHHPQHILVQSAPCLQHHHQLHRQCSYSGPCGHHLPLLPHLARLLASAQDHPVCLFQQQAQRIAFLRGPLLETPHQPALHHQEVGAGLLQLFRENPLSLLQSETLLQQLEVVLEGHHVHRKRGLGPASHFPHQEVEAFVVIRLDSHLEAALRQDQRGGNTI